MSKFLQVGSVQCIAAGKRIFCRSLFLLSVLCFCVFSMTGCGLIRIQALFTPTFTREAPTETPTPEPTATEVIEWFPATSTPRPLNTPTPFPTVNYLPELGRTLLEENFDTGDNWQVFRSDSGSALVSNHELTLAIQDSAVAIYTFSRLPQYADYYLSMDVDVSLCSYYRDTYAILFRVADSSNLYRWSFNCRGETKVERVYRGKTLLLSNWAESTYLRPGAPQKFNIGLSASGSTFNFFINEFLVASVEDPLLTDGGYGLMASSDGYAPITVSFSELSISELK